MILGGVILFFVKGNDAPVTITNTKIDTVYQKKTFTIYKKGNKIPFVVLDTLYKIDEIHDTIKIIQDFSMVKVYNDTISVDSNTYVIIDTITHNTLIGRSFKANIVEKTIYVTNTIQSKSKNDVYLGVIGDLRAFDNKVGIGGSLAIKTAKNALFTLSATTNQYSIGYYAKF